MEEVVQWATNVANKKTDMEKKAERHRARAQTLEQKTETSGEEDEKSEPNNQLTNIKADERVRKTSSDLRREILDLGGAENITELCKRKKKKTKKKSSSRVSVEVPVLGPVDSAEFMNAAIQGELKVVEKYLADGGNPNVHDELKRTALHRASIEGHSAVVQKLLEKGADIHFKDRLDSRAIHWACRGGSLGVVTALQSHGADLNVRDK
uniref:uncharacterized protein ankrd2 n=1 Tax=Centroberyx gerrardi TaxID=166262 RepID=UPI003AAAF2B6